MEVLYPVILAIAFIIPGFIITSIKNKVIPCRNKEYNMKIINFFVYSFLNLFLWSIPIYLMFKDLSFCQNHFFMTWLILLIIIFISPTAIALVIIFINESEKIKTWFSNLNINIIEPEPSAWDFKFSNMSSKWVIVTLKDDKIIAGFMGSDSCASSNENDRDLYINEVYKIIDGKWEKVKNTNGILIKQEEIKYIEFFNTKQKGGKSNEKSK